MQEQRVRHQLTLEVKTCRARRDALDLAAPTIVVRRDELTAARRAAHIVPRIEACASANARLAAATRERTAAEAAALSRTDAERVAGQHAAQATVDAEPCADLARQHPRARRDHR